MRGSKQHISGLLASGLSQCEAFDQYPNVSYWLFKLCKSCFSESLCLRHNTGAPEVFIFNPHPGAGPVQSSTYCPRAAVAAGPTVRQTLADSLSPRGTSKLTQLHTWAGRDSLHLHHDWFLGLVAVSTQISFPWGHWDTQVNDKCLYIPSDCFSAFQISQFFLNSISVLCYFGLMSSPEASSDSAATMLSGNNPKITISSNSDTKSFIFWLWWWHLNAPARQVM